VLLTETRSSTISTTTLSTCLYLARPRPSHASHYQALSNMVPMIMDGISLFPHISQRPQRQNSVTCFQGRQCSCSKDNPRHCSRLRYHYDTSDQSGLPCYNPFCRRSISDYVRRPCRCTDFKETYQGRAVNMCNNDVIDESEPEESSSRTKRARHADVLNVLDNNEADRSYSPS